MPSCYCVITSAVFQRNVQVFLPQWRLIFLAFFQRLPRASRVRLSQTLWARRVAAPTKHRNKQLSRVSFLPTNPPQPLSRARHVGECPCVAGTLPSDLTEASTPQRLRIRHDMTWEKTGPSQAEPFFPFSLLGPCSRPRAPLSGIISPTRDLGKNVPLNEMCITFLLLKLHLRASRVLHACLEKFYPLS